MFRPNGTFTFQSEGHYGNSIVEGIYVLSDSIVFINPETEWTVRHGALKTKLKIINAECVRDYDDNYYCTDMDSVNHHIDQEMAFQAKVIGILDRSSVVRNERQRLETKGLDDLTDVALTYGGIIVIKSEEYHLFYLNEISLEDTFTHLRFVVSKHPLEIYQHSLQGDHLQLLIDNK